VKTRAAIVDDRAAPLRIEEVELDPPGPGEVLVRIEACGVCRSDLCRPCRRGRPALCERVAMSTRGAGGLCWRGRTVDRFMGLGAFGERVVVPEAMAVPVLAEMPASRSCLLVCAVMISTYWPIASVRSPRSTRRWPTPGAAAICVSSSRSER
jgi:Zn-dependent alcohol dehydrogenase